MVYIASKILSLCAGTPAILNFAISLGLDAIVEVCWFCTCVVLLIQNYGCLVQE
jgi:hypothetical protein